MCTPGGKYLTHNTIQYDSTVHLTICVLVLALARIIHCKNHKTISVECRIIMLFYISQLVICLAIKVLTLLNYIIIIRIIIKMF